MRRTHAPNPHVSFSTQAWKQVGTMSYDVFLSLQKTLERMANELRPQGPQPPQRLTVGGVEVLYTWDEATRTIHVADLRRTRSELE
jgi:hypothetical protein